MQPASSGKVEHMTRRFTTHTNPVNLEAQRKRELGHIHEGQKALGWSEDDYRFHLRNLTGKSSSKDLDHTGRRKVLDHMAACGYKPKAKPFKPFDQAEKIRWLWKKIGEAGGLHDDSQAALLVFAGRTTGTGVSELKFLPVREASNVIEALKAMLDRAKKAHAVESRERL